MLSPRRNHLKRGPYLSRSLYRLSEERQISSRFLHPSHGTFFFFSSFSSPRTGGLSQVAALASRDDDDRSGWLVGSPVHTAVHCVLNWALHPRSVTVKRVRSLASRAPNPAFVPGETRSNCWLQRLTFSSSRHDASPPLPATGSVGPCPCALLIP